MAEGAASCPRCASTPRAGASPTRPRCAPASCDAPGADEPRRRDRRRRRRRRRLADRATRCEPGWSCGWPCSTTCSPAGTAERAAAGRRARGRRDAPAAAPAPPARRRDLVIARRAAARPGRRVRRRRRPARRAGVIAAIGAASRRHGAEVIDADGLIVAARPSSTRTCTCARPGRSTRRTSPSAPRRGGRGRLRAILAMPNTHPVVDTAAVLGALLERAAPRRLVRVGFFGAITRGPRRRGS